ncbi:MAG: diguanylate cyclase [Deltaproteobacteria bacterium]|nr:diguanylate cyclase [Deltaproteobacteria bacterium]
MTEARSVKRRIGMRLAMVAGIVAFGVFIAGVLVLLPMERKAVRAMSEDQVALIAEVAATTFQMIDARTRSHRASEVLTRLGAAPSVRAVSVLNSVGEVTWSTDSSMKAARPGLHKEMKYVHQNREDIVVTWQLPFAESCMGCHQKQSAPLGAVQVVVKREAVFSKLEGFHLFGGLFALVSFLVLVLTLAFTAERMVGRPVYKLARLMDKARNGDFNVRARLRREDEIGALAQAFNSMLQATSSLKAAGAAREADLQKAQHELQLKKQVEKFASQLEESNVALERRVKAQELLMDASHQLASTLDRKELLDGLNELVNFVLGWADFAIFLVWVGDDGEPCLETASVRGRADVPRLRNCSAAIGEGVIGRVAETGLPFHVPDVASWEEEGLESDILDGEGAFLCIPMMHKGRVVGVMTFLHKSKHVFDDDDLQLLQALASQAATAVVNADLFEATRELSVKDPLTQLMNRRAMGRHLEMELVRAQRFSHPLGVLMIDVDHFKSYNDRMGHLLGDEALKAVANELRTHVRKVDAVARYGGEEFCIILPRSDEKAAVEVAEKLSREICNLSINGASDQPMGLLSVSVGVSTFPDDLPDAVQGSLEKQLIDAADKALFAAKIQGRNRVVSASSMQGRKPRAGIDEVVLKKTVEVSAIVRPETIDDDEANELAEKQKR